MIIFDIQRFVYRQADDRHWGAVGCHTDLLAFRRDQKLKEFLRRRFALAGFHQERGGPFRHGDRAARACRWRYHGVGFFTRIFIKQRNMVRPGGIHAGLSGTERGVGIGGSVVDCARLRQPLAHHAAHKFHGGDHLFAVERGFKFPRLGGD